MKKRLSIFGLLFAFMAFTAHAQITTKYEQHFEDATPVGYTVTAGGATQTSIVAGGSKALKMTHTNGQQVILTLDTLDFSDSASFNFFTLEFSHICFANAMKFSVTDRLNAAYLEAQIVGTNNWIRLNSTYYHTENGSTEFMNQSSFSDRSYAQWTTACESTPQTLSNQLWMQERFDLDQVFQNVTTVNRKVIIRFVLMPRQGAANNNDGWYIDDITVRASSQAITAPTITMRSFPDHLNYPNSRGARLVLDATTSVLQGINRDSVYAEYTVGHDPTVQRAYLTRQSGSLSNRYVGRIPFYGYDTLMTFRVVVKDSTRNNNTTTYPKNASQRITYRCVRGTTNSVDWPGNKTNKNTFPFPNYADNRSEFCYDSATLASLGYKPGAITKLRYQVNNSANTVSRPHLQIRLANMVSASYQRGQTDETFTGSAFQIVYDSVFTIPQASPNSYIDINLQDTFFYAGGDIVCQFYYDGTTNTASTPVKHVPTAAGKMSLYMAGYDDFYTYNAFTDNHFNSGYTETTRPWMRFYANQNVPLIHDCGVSGFAYPSYTMPCVVGTDSVVVWLKNYGVSPMHSVDLFYKIDNGATVSHAWTGVLNGGDSCRVVMNTSQNFTVGYHTIRAWVGDSITVNGVRVRDHEPYNDTCNTPFAACDGPYSGVRTIGQANANIPTLDKFLYVLSRCGIDAPLTVKLPAGTYDVTTFPYIPGTSATNYVQFEPATASAVVKFRRNGDATPAPSLVNIEQARSVRFKNITFINGTNPTSRCNTLVLFGSGSNHTQFLDCTFLDSNTIVNSAEALVQAYECDSTLIQNCTFVGGKIGLHMLGPAPDDRASNNVIYGNNFASQANNAIFVQNQDGVLVDSNFCDDVLTNTSYIIFGRYCFANSRIVRNKVYSTKGACCIGVKDIMGTQASPCYVANNMMVSLDDGTTNQLVTPLNIISGTCIRVAFNSIRLKAPTRVGIAAATLGGGDGISDSYFQNNVVACFDSSNYAFSLIPGDNTNSLHVDHNCYYSISGVLNRLYTDNGSTNYNNLNSWNNAIACESGSVSGNPNYTNSSVSTVDLRTFNDLLRNAGVAVPGITTDLFGTGRATPPSIGAYEVTPLTVDFAPVELVDPVEDNCGAQMGVHMKVAVRNVGVGTYTGTIQNPITIFYRIDNGSLQTYSITNRTVASNDTVHLTCANRTENFNYGADNSDKSYNVTWYVKCGLDPDDLNDTARTTVLSRYAPGAPNTINMTISYATPATITPTSGVDNWPVNYYTSGRSQRSGISWYHTNDYSEEKFYYGPTLVTDTLFDDTTFYISQRRNLPLVKITEVQVNRTAAGATNPMPSFMNSSTAFAVELTNVGDYEADLEGDSIVVVMPSGNPKIWELPRVTIQPHASLVLQFKTSTTASDSTRTIFCPSTATASPAYNANFGVVYRDGHGVADAVAFNSVTTLANWTSQNVPQAAWKGSGIAMGTTACAGAYRTSWPSSTTSIANTSTLWQKADATHLMHIGTVEDNLILYSDNGCEGMRAQVNITINPLSIPTTDLAVEVPVVDTGCNLTTAEQVHVTVRNYGAQAASNVTVKMSLDGGSTIYSTASIASIASQGMAIVTFPQTINMHQNQDSVFHIKVWVDAIASDARRTNDTNSGDFLSRFTPDMPMVNDASVNYNGIVTLTPSNFPYNRAVTRWYDTNHDSVYMSDYTNPSYTTPHIYHLDTFYAQYQALQNTPNTHVGTLASIVNNNFPSPYNPKLQYVHEQYIYTADQIQAAGHGAGLISSIAFYLNSLGTGVTDFTFSDYTIKIGPTTLNVFPNQNFLTDDNTSFTTVYSSSDLTLDASNIGWVEHDFNTPYAWDGTSNLVIDILRTLSTAGINAGANTRYTSQANTVITKSTSNTVALTSATGTKGGYRPDLLIGFMEPKGCLSPEKEIHITVTGVPNSDATIEWDPALDTMVIASCASTALNVKLTNRGETDINSYTLRYKVDNNPWQQTTGNANGLQLGRSTIKPLMSQALTPGRHSVIAVVDVPNDTIASNDTIRRVFNVKFCAGDYEVGPNAGTDGYPTLAVAIDTLNNAGVAGPIQFLLEDGTFNEQVTIGAVEGASSTNTVTFTTSPQAFTPAKIQHTPANTSNFVVKFDGAHDIVFRNLELYGNYTSGSGNNIFANVVAIDNSSNIRLVNTTIRSKKTTATTTNASLVLMGDNNHYITIDSCRLDSGYFAIRTTAANTHSDNITITNSVITNFWFRGINLRDCDTVIIQRDSLAAGVATAGKPLHGIYIANGSYVRIEKNFVYLVDKATGGKRGIMISNCKGSNLERVNIYNNMVSVYGTAVASLSSSGIWIDSNSRNVNVYYNSARLNAGTSQTATRTFSAQLSSNIHVLNNIFQNESKGYAYYVAVDTCVAASNFNVYYSNSPYDTNARGVVSRKFAYWGGADRICLDTLRAYNNKDVNSVEERPYFVDTNDLRMLLGQFVGLGQYNPDVPQDIFNVNREQPNSCIGAHEFKTVGHNITIAEFIDPKMPEIITGTNAQVYNIETDSILVTINFYNNGESRERGTWYAYLDGSVPLQISPEREIDLPLRTLVTDSCRLYSPLGMQDTQRIICILDLPAYTDIDPSDNRDTCEFFIYPAYDLKCDSIRQVKTTAFDSLGCRLYSVGLKYTIKNVGKKDFPGDYPFKLGWKFYYQGNPQPDSTVKQYSEQEVVTFGQMLPMETSYDVFLQTDKPNLYPYGLGEVNANTSIKIKGWPRYEHDIKTQNDTCSIYTISSNSTPLAPVGSDTTVDYGSYGNLWATQQHQYKILWTRLPDTTSRNFYYDGTSHNYNTSRHWKDTPQFFHDSTYWLYCKSNKNCPSYFNPIHVGINPALDTDVSISQVLSPRSSGRVYLECDTVKIRVVNYGANPISNIPVHYKWMNANGRTVLKEIDDTVRVTLAGRIGDQVAGYNFTFDSLLPVNQPISNVSYQLQCWTDLPNDQQRGNDTLRYNHTFKALGESIYDSINSMAPTDPAGFDISRVSFNCLDNPMPDMIGYTTLDLGHYNQGADQIPVLRVVRGTSDTLWVEVANNQDEYDTTSEASLVVAIDYNRDGEYNLANYENITRQGSTVGVKVKSRQAYPIPLTIIDSAQFGYQRMLVWVDGDPNAYLTGFNTATTNGQLQQYLLFVIEPGHQDTVDMAVTRVSTPREHLVEGDSAYRLSVMIANRGLNPVQNATISYQIFNSEMYYSDTIAWSGIIQPGESKWVNLRDSVFFGQGTSNFVCRINVPNDADSTNDSIRYQWHRNYQVVLRFIDSFDVDNNFKWYVPAGYNQYTTNYFERGIPAKSNITGASSLPNAMITSTTQTIASGDRGNRSVLYTPIINIAQIQPDTLEFDICKNLSNGSHLRLEYIDWEHNWQVMDYPSSGHGGASGDTTWYDDEQGWTGSSGIGVWQHHMIPTSLFRGDLDQRIQFRFVYTTPTDQPAGSTFGEGAAIDNFRIGRARRSVDVGVRRIVKPDTVQYGQTYYPKVLIHNYGTDTVSQFLVSYIAYGTYLPVEETYRGLIQPDEDVEYTFRQPFVITNLYPDTFEVKAFTSAGRDIYKDNDTCIREFVLSPLEDDLQMQAIVSPLASAVAGDSIYITVRLRNFGSNDIDTCNVYYSYNGGAPVSERVIFSQLNTNGQPLHWGESINYTFTHRERATMGTMQLTTWCKYNRDTYVYNDTLSKQIAGIAAIVDMGVVGAFFDTRSHTDVHIALELENQGALAANSFPCWYYWDNDPSTLQTDTVYFDTPIPSGQRRVFTCRKSIPTRTQPWEHVRAWIAVPGDTNHTNDTTNEVHEMFVDLSVDGLEIEENRNDSCRLRMIVSNLGNITFNSGYNYRVKVNGFSANGQIPANYSIDPGATRHIVLTKNGREVKCPKDTVYRGSIALDQVNNDNNVANNNSTRLIRIWYFEGVSDVEDANFELEQNYPNPYDGKTSIEFAIPTSGLVKFAVTDVVGRQVFATAQNYAEGRHTIIFDRADLPAGIYYYVVEFDGQKRMHKMIVR